MKPDEPLAKQLLRLRQPPAPEIFFGVALVPLAMLNGFIAAYTYRDYIGPAKLAWTTARQDSMLIVGTVLGTAALLYAVYFFTTPRARPFKPKLVLLCVLMVLLAIAAMGQIGWALWFDLGYHSPRNA